MALGIRDDLPVAENAVMFHARACEVVLANPGRPTVSALISGPVDASLLRLACMLWLARPRGGQSREVAAVLTSAANNDCIVCECWGGEKERS